MVIELEILEDANIDFEIPALLGRTSLLCAPTFITFPDLHSRIGTAIFGAGRSRCTTSAWWPHTLVAPKRRSFRYCWLDSTCIARWKITFFAAPCRIETVFLVRHFISIIQGGGGRVEEI